MVRRIAAAVASIAVVAGGQTLSATPAVAAVSNASISPSTWQPGEQAQAIVTFDSSTAAVGSATEQMSIEIGWGWVYQYRNPSLTPAVYTATYDATAKSYSCATIGVTFQSDGFASPPGAPSSVECRVLASSSYSGNPGQMVTLTNTAAGGFTFTASNTVVVTFAAGTITAPASGPASDTWRIIDVAGGSGVTVRTAVPGPDGTIPPPPPPVTLDFDGNGGTCSPSSVVGEQGTWGSALTADKCTNGSRRLAFFSTSPTAQSGAVNVLPGGPVYFLESNKLYAIWAFTEPSPATDVVATPGLNSVKVTWKAPTSNGGDPVRGYRVLARPVTAEGNSFYPCSTTPVELMCTVNLPATNAKYTFTVLAGNSAGTSESSASAAVSPYDFKDVTASRSDILFGLGGTRVEASGAAPGLAGQALNVEFKVGAAPNWTTLANAVKVNAESKFSWSRKFPLSANKQAVSVRFTYGADAAAGPYVLPRGGVAGDLSAPRNIKVNNEVNRVNITWDPPRFDGGAKITGYTVCATPSWGPRTCRSESGTQSLFTGLKTDPIYTITVAATTASREGPVAKAAKTVKPTEASIRIVARSSGELSTSIRGEGFKANSRFRVEIASPVPGANVNTWAWDEVRSFKEQLSFFRLGLTIPLDAGSSGERLLVRLVTPTGTVYSRPSRP